MNYKEVQKMEVRRAEVKDYPYIYINFCQIIMSVKTILTGI